MAFKRRIIMIPRGTIDKICKAEKVGRTTVYAALNYTSNSEDAKRIRKRALSIYGGVETTKPIF